MDKFGFSEIYDVSLKATFPIEVNGVEIKPGEVVAAFDKIQMANFNEVKDRAAARGGYANAPRVYWESTKEIQIDFVQGVFSKVQYALMTNARLLAKKDDDFVLISKREKVESDEEGIISLTNTPDGTVFIYNSEGKKIEADADSADPKKYSVGEPYKDFVVDYTFKYTNKAATMVVGQQLTNGFLSFEGKTRVKDDVTGQTKTAIIKIPKLKLMSSLSMRLGENATPLVGRLSAVAVPTGSRSNPIVMEVIFLDDDIDSDM